MTADECTPTTAEVRERFIDGFPIEHWTEARAAEGDAFDRWLAQHEAAIRADQIEREVDRG